MINWVVGKEYVDRKGSIYIYIGSKTNGRIVFENACGALVTRDEDGKFVSDRESDNDIIIEAPDVVRLYFSRRERSGELSAFTLNRTHSDTHFVEVDLTKAKAVYP